MQAQETQPAPTEPDVKIEQVTLNANAWINKMAFSLRNLNYNASFMLMRSRSDFEPYHWRHGVVDGIEMEHLSLLNGPGREVVRIGDRISFFEPNVPAYTIISEVIDGPIPSQLLIDPSKLSASYDFILVGRSRVSGRAAQQIRIVSKGNYRYGYILWLDQETALPLRLDMQDLQGQTIEQLQVTSLEITEQAHEYFSRVKQQKLPPLVVPNKPTASQSRISVGWLPLGMEEVRRDIHLLPVTREPVDYVMLSDGLVDISVYLQRMGDKALQKGWLAHGSSTLLSTQVGEYEVTVIGKLPPKTAKTIAESIQILP